MTSTKSNIDQLKKWSSPIPEQRWLGFRRKHRGMDAFKNLPVFEEAQVMELSEALDEHERKTLGRLLARGNADEIQVFISRLIDLRSFKLPKNYTLSLPSEAQW